MKFSLGFLDQLFGEKITLELPDGNGKIVKRTVTKKWMDQMMNQGKMSIVTDVIRVHILDPLYEDGYKVENWTIGEDINQETVTNFQDPQTGDLYAIVVYENGKGKTMVLKKELFDDGLKRIKNIG